MGSLLLLLADIAAARGASRFDDAARAGLANITKELLQDSQLAPSGGRGARIDFDDLAILKTILAKARNLVVLVETNGDHLAVDFYRSEERRLVGGARNIVIAVALKIDAGRRGG